jgi:hypothetical protein
MDTCGLTLKYIELPWIMLAILGIFLMLVLHDALLFHFYIKCKSLLLELLEYGEFIKVGVIES